MDIFVSSNSPAMQQYLESLTTELDPFEIIAAKEEEHGHPLVFSKRQPQTTLENQNEHLDH